MKGVNSDDKNQYTNFYRFRNRVIYSINKNIPLKHK